MKLETRLSFKGYNDWRINHCVRDAQALGCKPQLSVGEFAMVSHLSVTKGNVPTGHDQQRRMSRLPILRTKGRNVYKINILFSSHMKITMTVGSNRSVAILAQAISCSNMRESSRFLSQEPSWFVLSPVSTPVVLCKFFMTHPHTVDDATCTPLPLTTKPLTILGTWAATLSSMRSCPC